MTRGNQRELARQKSMKKAAEQKKGRDIPEGLNVTAVKIMDADIMRQKQQKALEKKEQEEQARLAALRASKTK